MSAAAHKLNPDSRIYVAGHNGMVGSAIWRELESRGFANLVGQRSSVLDLRDRSATLEYFAVERPDVVIDAAARVGGILANNSYPAEFLSDNLLIQLNIMDAAAGVGVERLLFLGSSCIYPKFADQPIREHALLSGPLEPTNEAYAIAKIAGILQVQAIRRQYGFPWISAMPTNLYGQGDNFDLTTSHVLPAMIRKFHEAKIERAESVTLWGTGTPSREFLHCEDLARAVIFLLEHYDSSDTINVGVGKDVTIRDLAEIVASVIGFKGTIDWDSSKPDGTPRKLLDVSRINRLGWRAEISLREGIKATYAWYLENLSEAQ